MIRVTVWNENLHEQRQEEVRKIYPKGIHGCIADFLGKEEALSVRTATLEEPEHGLTEAVLEDTDVLIYWSHMAQEEFAEEVALRIRDHVQRGMGLVALHSSHASKMMRVLLGTSTTLRWRHGDRERLFVTAPYHPIAEGIPERFDLPIEEMYGEYFDIPKPDDVVFTGWFAGGEVFRSGCTFVRGLGKIFYFQPGHESYPTYYNPHIQRIIRNAVYWCAPTRRRGELECTPVKASLEAEYKSRRRLSVFYEHIREASEQSGRSVEEVLRLCRCCGISGVEVDYSVLKADESGLLERFRQAKLEIASLYQFFEFGRKERREAELALARELTDKARELGVSHIMIIPGFLEEERAEELNRLAVSASETARFLDGEPAALAMRDALREITAYAGARGITVSVEDFDGATSPIARIGQLGWFFDQVPGLMHTLDTGNYAFSDEDVRQAYGAFRDRIVHVHCKDRGEEPGEAGRGYRYRRGLAPVPVGGGYLPVGELVRRLKESGYEGWFAIEHFGASDQLIFMLESAAYLKNILEE